MSNKKLLQMQQSITLAYIINIYPRTFNKSIHKKLMLPYTRLMINLVNKSKNGS